MPLVITDYSSCANIVVALKRLFANIDASLVRQMCTYRDPKPTATREWQAIATICGCGITFIV